MNQHTLNRIANVLTTQFEGLIDLSDQGNKPEDVRRSVFLSRALAALCIKSLAGTDPEAAAKAVVDGFDDGGIDAIYFDTATDTLLLVQSKWSGNGDAAFDEGNISKFTNGIQKLLNANFEKFNSKVRAKEAEIREALFADRPVRIRIATIHTARQAIAPHVAGVIEKLVTDLNDPVPIADRSDFDQAGVYDLITAESKDPKIKIQVGLNDWGEIAHPYLAYYGRLSVGQIVEWWKAHRDRLFSQNLRLFYQSSNVNDALRRTLETDPESFWYFNNGITIIADKVSKSIAGAPGRQFALFTCEGASVVNGAQTVGTIGTAAEAGVAGSENEATWVQVRIISLEKCPPEFARRITRAANLQNAVGNREFAAMDPLQHKLAVEFALDKRRYVYKRGETDPRGSEGCSIVEATQALACAHSVGLAVEVKREISALWADTDGPPYTDIFNANVTAERVWKAVSVTRTVDEVIQVLRISNEPRADLVGTHMHRIVLHLVFQDSEVKSRFLGSAPIDDLLAVAKKAVQPIFKKVAAYLERQHPNDYLANFSKNPTKCAALVRNLDAPDPSSSPSEQPIIPGLG